MLIAIWFLIFGITWLLIFLSIIWFHYSVISDSLRSVSFIIDIRLYSFYNERHGRLNIQHLWYFGNRTILYLTPVEMITIIIITPTQNRAESKYISFSSIQFYQTSFLLIYIRVMFHSGSLWSTSSLATNLLNWTFIENYLISITRCPTLGFFL